MEIALIPNLISLRLSAPSALPPDLPTPRAIDFRGQQNQDDQNQDDATYTPGDRDGEGQGYEEQQKPALRALQMPQAATSNHLDEPGEPPTISVFA